MPGHATPPRPGPAQLGRATEPAAWGAAPEAVFAAVVDAASRLLDGRPTSLVRFEDDGSSLVLAVCGGSAPVGARAPAGRDSLAARVRRTARATRIDDVSVIDADGVRAGWGVRAAVAVPVTVHGSPWGLLATTSADGPLPPDTELRLGELTEIVSAAVAGTQAWSRLRDLADEQAAIRRVAELVAHGAALDEVFAAVATETSVLLGDLAAALLRYDPGEVAVAVAVHNSPAPVGLRVPSSAGNPVGEVLRTGRAIRVESFDETSLAKIAARLGVRTGVAVPVVVEGRVWGTLTTSSSGPPLPAGTEHRLQQFAELAAAAIANAENKAKLTASRARVVATADETRRRLQRDVHDSAQQRLVHTVITLKLAKQAIASGEDPADLVDEALRNAERAAADLRDVVRGILPAALTRGGLAAGLESLVDDLPLPVRLRVTVPRLPPSLETTAYFVVAEALANVVKHARATHAAIEVVLHGRTVVIDVRDDGAGGADPRRGTGLTGLLDRVEAGEGILTISSPAGAGTTVHAELPLPPGPSTGSPTA